MFDCTDAEIASWTENSENRAESLELEECLDAHIAHLWDALPVQSKKRLECLAVSAGTAVSPENHSMLAGALELIAEEEGTLEEEAEFAPYLGLSTVCQAIAESSRRRGSGKTTTRRQSKSGGERAADSRQKEERLEARFEEIRERIAIAIDGEGVTLEDGSHIYRYMAACLSDGTVLAELDREDGITTREALDFVSSLGWENQLGIFGYGMGYDQCKWLEDLPNNQLFDLFHAEDLKPKAKLGPYRLNMLGKCLQIMNKRAPHGRKKTLVWDILKAFQATFVNALKTWKVGTKEEWDRIEAMKKKRGDFANQSWDDVKHYCKDECRLLAALVEKYVQAHCDAGIDLRGKYHGAGSTGDAFLRLMGAEQKRCNVKMGAKEGARAGAHRAMRSAWSRAFFGGRSEISRLGLVKGPLWTYDIGSAYPHALYSLPCMVHGKWHHVTEHVTRAAISSRLACVHYEVTPDALRRVPEAALEAEAWEKINLRSLVLSTRGGPSRPAWGPLPYRTAKASIVFPTAGPGGWAWTPEFEIARQHWPGVKAKDAWVLRGECACERPYQAIGEYYLKRLEWGKEGPGLVLKLGLNSCYGKFAQVIGKNPKHSCRVVAGVITGTTRARILEAIASAEDPWSVVYVATDGIITDAPIAPPDPEDNDTKEGAKAKGKVMLGAWESEKHDDTYFVVQPGFYFSTKPAGKAKTRGMPLDVIDRERDKILEQWRREPLEPPRGLPKRSVFRGVKQSILRPTKSRPRYLRKPCYGRWEEEERELKYVVNPKRSHPEPIEGQLASANHRGTSFRLFTWELDMDQPESAEYKKDPGHGEAREFMDDQPDFVEVPGTNVGE